MRFFPVIAAWLTACGVQYPAPAVTGVSPDRGWNGEDTVVSIRGEGFYPEVWVEAGGREREHVDDDFAALLVDEDGVEHELGANLVAYDTIEATVRSGLAPGLYDVVVESPGGLRGRLPGGFTVSDTVAAAIELRTESGVSATVQTGIPVEVLLVDNAGDVVSEAGLAVRFWLTDVTGARYDGVEVEAEGMFEVEQPTAPGGDLTAVLGSQGNRLVVTVGDAGVYDLHAAPQRDASIAQATEGLEWLPAAMAPLRITLPSTPWVAQAGVPFDVELAWYDLFGNPVPGYRAPVVLQDNCGGELLYDSQVEASWTGSTTVSLTIRNLCAGPSFIRNNRDGGESAVFTMQAGPPARLNVLAPVGPVVAGVPFTRDVYVEDSEGNGTDFPGGSIALSASSGGLQSVVCGPVVGGLDGEFSCTATATVAAPDVRLDAVGSPGGITGSSPLFAVVANSAAIGSLTVSSGGQATAGAQHRLQVRPSDAWGNPVSGAMFADPLAWRVTDELGEADCAWLQTTAGDEAEIGCTLYTARAATLTVELLSAGVTEDVPLTVVNGPLDQLATNAAGPGADPHVFAAGELVHLTAQGFDAWGNPTTVLASSTVQLTDDRGSMSPVVASLDATGRLEVDRVFTVAGSTVVRASQLGVELGASPSLTVLPGPTSGLNLNLLDAPWAWVGDPVDVRVESIDAWGNRTAWTGSVDVDSRLTASPTTQVSVTNGVGTGSFSWSQSALDDALDAAGGGWTGASALVDVADDCGPVGPAAAVDFAGFAEAVSCVSLLSGQAATSASMASTIPGSSALSRYEVAVEGAELVRSSTPSMGIALPGTGVHRIRALAVDAAGCGSETSAVGYAGPDDGSPVGPLVLAPALSPIVAGVGSTPVDLLGVTDCSRDVAPAVSVRVRADLGDIAGASATGAGLAVTTDVSGDAMFTLDATAVGTGGTATLHAWTPSGAAVGQATVAISGDDVRPEVWAQTPSGEELGSLSSIAVEFSEPMLAATVSSANISLGGPGPASVSQVTLDAGGRTATVTLAPDADGALGVWTLTLSDQVRDLAGNRLSGDWSGFAAPYVGTFGDVAAAVDPVSCLDVTPVSRVFRPDGDDGPGSEADTFDVDILAVVAPAWWELTIEQASTGERVRRERILPLGGSDLVRWDGRDQAGQVVANGTWDVIVAPLDGQGNRGAGCQVDVVVDNELGGVP